jgi:hypothetical protein
MATGVIEVSEVFTEMDRALEARGFHPEDERSEPAAFGSRWRLYRRSPREALSLTWDGREGWLLVQGGIPWRDLAIVRTTRDQDYHAADVVSAMLRDVARVADYDPTI